MDAATIQSKVYAGYGKAALRVGPPFTQYRPQTSINPISLPNMWGIINATFSGAKQTQFPFSKPNDYRDILWSGLFDASNVQVGDYLVNDKEGTFFVAALQHLLPPLCVECSRTFSVVREAPPSTNGGIGLQSYSGVSPSAETTVASGFPGAMQWSREGGRPYFDIPSDSPKKIGFLIFLPPIPGAIIRERDFLQDDLGRRFLAMGIYLSDLGYRIAAELMQA